MTIIGIFDELCDTTVDVIRTVATGDESPDGTPLTKPEKIIPALLCCTQTDENKLIMPIAGQTAIDYRILYCYLYQPDGTPNDIKLNDTIVIKTAPAGVNVGAEYLVTQVNDYAIDDMSHLEVKMQGGVL